MNLNLKTGLTTAALLVGALAIAGCPLKLEKEPGGNSVPTTFFQAMPPDTSFSNTVSFTWLGTDQDSDVVAYQYQFVQTDSLWFVTSGLEGRVIRSLDPRVELQPGDDDEIWGDRTTMNFQSFTDLDDGWFEMRVRAIDDSGEHDTTPARHPFYVFFDDRSPAIFKFNECPRLAGVTSWTFLMDAADSSRNGIPTPRAALEYSYQLRATSTTVCSTHLSDSFTSWKYFPDETSVIVIDGTTISIDGGMGGPYNDLFDNGCQWDFTFRVRDPAGNIATDVCSITQL